MAARANQEHTRLLTLLWLDDNHHHHHRREEKNVADIKIEIPAGWKKTTCMNSDKVKVPFYKNTTTNKSWKIMSGKGWTKYHDPDEGTLQDSLPWVPVTHIKDESGRCDYESWSTEDVAKWILGSTKKVIKKRKINAKRVRHLRWNGKDLFSKSKDQLNEVGFEKTKMLFAACQKEKIRQAGEAAVTIDNTPSGAKPMAKPILTGDVTDVTASTTKKINAQPKQKPKQQPKQQPRANTIHAVSFVDRRRLLSRRQRSQRELRSCEEYRLLRSMLNRHRRR